MSPYRAGVSSVKKLEVITAHWFRAGRPGSYLVPFVLLGMMSKYCVYSCNVDIYDIVYVEKTYGNKRDTFVVNINGLTSTSLCSSVPVKAGHVIRLKLISSLPGNNFLGFGFKDLKSRGFVRYNYLLFLQRGFGYFQYSCKKEQSWGQTNYSWNLVPNDIIKIERVKSVFKWFINNDEIVEKCVTGFKFAPFYFHICVGGEIKNEIVFKIY